jgi:hypothetical protein
MCSGALIKVDLQVRSVSAWAQYCLMHDRMLCDDSFNWKWVTALLVGHFGGRAMLAICGRSLW